MNKKITFRDVPHSDAMENVAKEQLVRVEEFLTHEHAPITIDLIFSPSKIHAHNRVELLIKTPHYDLASHFEGPDFYDALDKTIDKMYRLLLEQKDKRVEDRKMVGRHDEFKKQR
jgi:ribosomal subunit interface protein